MQFDECFELYQACNVASYPGLHTHVLIICTLALLLDPVCVSEGRLLTNYVNLRKWLLSCQSDHE